MMTPIEAFVEVEARKINLVHSFDAFWHASVDVKGENVSTKKRTIRSVSAIDLTPIGAVERLCDKLDNEAQREPQALF